MKALLAWLVISGSLLTAAYLCKTFVGKGYLISGFVFFTAICILTRICTK